MNDGRKIPEVFELTFKADPTRDIRKSARSLQKIGARRSGDVLILRRDDHVDQWQSDSFGDITFRLHGTEQYLDDALWDELVLEYPLTAVPKNWADRFIAFAEACSSALKLNLQFAGCDTTADAALRSLLSVVQDLEARHFEPGSKELRWLVESQRG